MLGANDGIVSTASLVLGVAAAGASGRAIVTAGIAGLMAGALSMAAGEYVSVSSQRDSEEADLRLEERELSNDPGGELRELADIYERRGLPADLALQVAVALSSGGALAAHARDELGLDEQRRARPLQAAWASAVSFSAGAILPLVAIGVSPPSARAVICVCGDARRARPAGRHWSSPRRRAAVAGHLAGPRLGRRGHGGDSGDRGTRGDDRGLREPAGRRLGSIAPSCTRAWASHRASPSRACSASRRPASSPLHPEASSRKASRSPR